jgi:hypothetical protein
MPGQHRAPEAADAAQHDDEEGRHHRVHAHVRPQAPDRRHDDAGDRGERRAQREYAQAQAREVVAERAHHLAVVRARLDHGAHLVLLDEEPERHDQHRRDAAGEEAVLRVDEVAQSTAPEIASGTGSTRSREPHAARISSSITSAAPKVSSSP